MSLIPGNHGIQSAAGKGGDASRGLLPVTHHATAGPLQAAPNISLYKQKVLEEDEYMEALSTIIRRDFFPDLEAFEREKQRWEERRRAGLGPAGWTGRSGWQGDVTTGRQHLGATPGQTPFGRSSTATPLPYASTSVRAGTKATRYDPSLSLDAFCARYTSEDNASFAEILNNANISRRSQYAWAFEATEKQNRKAIEEAKERRNLVDMVNRMVEGGNGVGLLEGGAGRPGDRKMVGGVVTREERLALEQEERDATKLLKERGEEGQATNGGEASIGSSAPRPAEETAEGANEKDDKGKARAETDGSGAVAVRPHQTRNSLMYAPDAEIPGHMKLPPPPFPEGGRAPLGQPKAIVYRNTRLDEIMEDTEREAKRRRMGSSGSSVTLSPTRSHIAAAISGTPYPAREPNSPRVNGFPFVSSMPTPNPALLAPEAMDNLMTWGELASTPRPVSSDDPEAKVAAQGNPAGPFRIPATPHREELAMGLARKATRSLKERHGVGLGIGTKLRKSMGRAEWGIRERGEAGSTPRREEVLSPAAKLLLKKTGKGVAETGMRRAMIGGSRAAGGWTPRGGEEEMRKEAEAKRKLDQARWDSTPASGSGSARGA